MSSGMRSTSAAHRWCSRAGKSLLPSLLAAVGAAVTIASFDEPGRAAIGEAATAPTPPAQPSLPTVFDAPDEASAGASRAAGSTLAGADRPMPEPEFVQGRLLVKFVDGTQPWLERKVLADAETQLEVTVRPLDVYVVDVRRGRTLDAIEELAEAPAVEYVERDAAVQSFTTTPNDTLWEQQWGPMLVRAPTAWDATMGSPGIIVAVLDTGIDSTHPDLQDAVVPGYDFVEGDAFPTDDNGHGTATAGVIGARTNNSRGQAGLCWRCSLMPIKVLNANRSGTTSAVAAGLVWAVDNGARVISMSLGGSEPTRTLAEAVDYAVRKGAVLVAAAGNESSQNLSYPAAYVGVIGVAGSDQKDVLYSWSNYGSWVPVAAPGCNIAPFLRGEYVNFCGTSAAAPVVAGIAGLALSGRPLATRTEVENALFRSANPIGTSVRYGRVNAELTLAALGVKPTSPAPALSPPVPVPVPAPALAPPVPAPVAPTAIPDRHAPQPERPLPDPPPAASGQTPARTPSPQVTTIRGTLGGSPLRFVVGPLRHGRLIATLTAPRARTLMLTLVDARGARVARISGRTPLRLSHPALPERYRVFISGSVRAPFTLRLRTGRS